jgi:hypothetical protein
VLKKTPKRIPVIHDAARQRFFGLSTDEVHDDKVEDHLGKDEVGEPAFWRDSSEHVLVLRVYLQPQTHCEEANVHVIKKKKFLATTHKKKEKSAVIH